MVGIFGKIMNATEKLARADYGIDAPGVVRGFAVAGISAMALGAVSYIWLGAAQPGIALGLFIAGVVIAIGCLATVGEMLWSSRVGKLHARDLMLRSIPWRGDEWVLDVGCGRGMLLIAAAKHLTRGKAIGIDLWSSSDQSDNRPESTWANAHAEGVAEQIQVRDGDARKLSFPDKTFNVIFSSLTLHHLRDPRERVQAVREMARVLKPGGRIALLDVRYTDEYAHALSECGLVSVRRSRPMLLFFSPVARVVLAKKPVV